ncbi:serine hydrolase [Siphonobacter sp. SORGH_AS_1065]|uniref:serine hydrolase domain-containing protein n=1 Tax=Siphonobacter sp. SORGH_AS_1065 TaxID=3041795 RepID=UPI00278183DE|nr:serine hydrolase domain-containing protein [Siphonobacter sp. SORGH_AS_1065]MDQ1087127.1 CubicO group peptidase (beta-lactamase class C family) [Siphonobacter sp. SORGH_AS_1065]
MMHKQVLTFIASLVILSSSAQTTLLEKKLDDLSNRLIANKEVVGMNVLLMQDGNVLYNKAFGYANVSTKQPLQTDHIFRIASQTKAITSLAALMLWEEGKFLLDDPLSKYIPAFKNPKVLGQFNPADSSYTTVPAQREITIRDLFRHTSGIAYPVFSGNRIINAVYAKAGIGTGIGSKGILKDQMLLLAKQPLFHQPGVSFTYGLNDDVLGYLIEVWSGMSLDTFLQSRIFEPLGMRDTYFHLPQSKAKRLVGLSVKDKDGKFSEVSAPIYEGNDPAYPLADGIYRSGGAGLVSTTADYAKFLSLFLNKGYARNKRVIGSKTLALLLTNQLPDEIKRPAGLQFGLGVALVTDHNKYLQSPSVGSFYWGGIFNTHYWVDQQQHLIGLVYTQQYDAYSEDIGHLFKNVIYASLDD